MKKLLMAITGLFLITNIAIAQDQNNSPPIANLTIKFDCVPTSYNMRLIEQLNFKKIHEINQGTLGMYQEWHGIDEDGNNIWTLILVASNGYSCRIDSGYVEERPVTNETPEESMEDKLDSFK